MTESLKRKRRPIKIVQESPKPTPPPKKEQIKGKVKKEVIKNFGDLSDDDQMKLLFQVFPVDTPDVIEGDASKNKVADAIMPKKAKG